MEEKRIAYVAIGVISVLIFRRLQTSRNTLSSSPTLMIRAAVVLSVMNAALAIRVAHVAGIVLSVRVILTLVH